MTCKRHQAIATVGGYERVRLNSVVYSQKFLVTHPWREERVRRAPLRITLGFLDGADSMPVRANGSWRRSPSDLVTQHTCQRSEQLLHVGIRFMVASLTRVSP